ncbi:efflux RND transporter periplasmic adaptor subunit [Pseudomonas sp. Irchel 3F5]|uniref:efflux RND transporter periplasmic adaptor subunit n=1 Tax=Pseudomonas sp. Irchel 3F5 TaxID=2009002 RepID=UPI00159504BF|nr:efflux RND transporter periplasmic adaptor subunit [Pseudomonas sp. Irchel 3F5]
MNANLRTRYKTWVVLAISTLMVVGVASYYLDGALATPTPSPPLALTPVGVGVASVIEKHVIEWSEFSGRVEAIEHVEIRPRVTGTIDTVNFQEGEIIAKGALLFTIDPRPYQAVLAKAQATRESAVVRLNLARTELARSSKLIQERATSQREHDQRANEQLEAQATLAAAQADVQAARLNLQYTSITAPVSGRVSRAELTVGNLVGTGPDAPLLTTIVSVSPVYVNFDLDEVSYIRYARNGTRGSSGVAELPVLMGLANETDYPYSGRIKSLDNQLDPSSGTLRVRAVFDNANGVLTPGMYARVRTGDGAPRTAVLIDDQAVGTDQSKRFVFVVTQGNTVEYREVHLGPLIDGLRVVRSGLVRGERIVVQGLQKVRPNDQVDPQPVASPVALQQQDRPARS